MKFNQKKTENIGFGKSFYIRIYRRKINRKGQFYEKHKKKIQLSKPIIGLKYIL